MTQGESGDGMPEAADWRSRMAVRGGPVSHAIARAGWAAFGMLGVLFMLVIVVVYAVNPGERGADNGVFGNLFGGIVVFLPIGAAIGALIGLPAQFAARSWLRTLTGPERRARLAARAKAAMLAESGLHPGGSWARSYQACARSVAAYHAVVGTMPDGAGRDWFTGIGASLDRELTEALRLARLGESLEPDADARLEGTASTVATKLADAESSFAETTERAVGIALELRDDSDFVRVRAQLDMLAEQAPRLRVEGSGP